MQLGHNSFLDWGRLFPLSDNRIIIYCWIIWSQQLIRDTASFQSQERFIQLLRAEFAPVLSCASTSKSLAQSNFYLFLLQAHHLCLMLNGQFAWTPFWRTVNNKTPSSISQWRYSRLTTGYHRLPQVTDPDWISQRKTLKTWLSDFTCWFCLTALWVSLFTVRIKKKTDT